MQSGDDLYTGVSPFPPETETNQQAQREQRQRAQELLPSVERLQSVIQDERESVRDIRTYISSLSFADRLKARLGGKSLIEDEFRAREIYLGFLDLLENRLLTDMAQYEEEIRRKHE